jgi:cytochrome c oxidase cbb3-type subunit III
MKKSIRTFCFAAITLYPLLGQAAEAKLAPTVFSNPLFNVLLAAIILLAIVIASLAGALRNISSSDFVRDRIAKAGAGKNGIKSGRALMILLSVTMVANAQGKPATDNIGGLDQLTFYCMISVIGLELLVIAVLLNTFKNLIGTERKVQPPARPEFKKVNLLDKLNDTVELENESEILMDHEYDGIRELDNNLPPWWKYGFYLTILVSVLYLINYHVTLTSPLQAEEYRLSMVRAEAEVAEYLKTAANNVDESTVKALTDPADLNSGREIFMGNCGACHGKSAEGGVGPNLTDQYWLRGGNISSIFKTIKYGSPDKGMKAWKDDLSAVQIAQLASYIRSLKNSNPPNGKEKQGELYIESDAPADTVGAGKNNISQVLNP